MRQYSMMVLGCPAQSWDQRKNPKSVTETSMIHRTGTPTSQRQGSWSYTPLCTTDGRQDTVEIFCTHGRRKLYVTEGINFHALEKEMATHFSVLAWWIPEMGKPGRLPSMGLHRVGHDWRDLAAEATSEDSLVAQGNCGYRFHTTLLG